MAEHDEGRVDPVTGRTDTGHEWDGIRELNAPLPRWWLWTMYATIVWAVGYWIVYPAWPLMKDYTSGVWAWNSRTAVERDLADLAVLRGETGRAFAAADIRDAAANPDLLNFARAQGRVLFADNCATCHGSGGAGAVGYPNLNDDDWLWGGSLEEIEMTLRHGIRSTDPETHPGVMMAFGRDGMLDRPQVTNVVHYVRSLSGLDVAAGADLAAGEEVFREQCVSCHGDEGKGVRELGAPNLTDAIWLYGSSHDAVFQSVWNGRSGVMPNWQGRLRDQEIKALAVYVHSLGGGE